RIRVADGAGQQALCVIGRRGRDHLEAGRLQEPGLRVLGMEGPAGEPTAGRQADDHRYGDALAVVQLAGDVDQLIEAAGDEVRDLHLRNRLHALYRGADRSADDHVLGERSVEDAT